MANTYKALSTVTVGAGGAATIAFTNIPQTYTDLVIRMSGRSTTTDVDMFFTFNSNTSNYTRRVLRGTGSNASSTTNNDNYATTIDGSGETSNTFANLEMYIPNYASSNFKAYSIDDVFENNSTTAYQYLLGGSWSNTSPATSLTFYFLSGGTFAQYTTATLYGVFNADVSSAPATPTIGSATATGTSTATVAFTPVSNAASYTATSTPGSLTATGMTSPLTVSGLTAATSYTFKVKSNNPFGSSAESAASNSITTNSTAYESIATVTGNGSATYLEFTGIPSTYSHLQIRLIGQPNNSGGGGTTSPVMRVNADSSSVYTEHWVRASSSTASAGNGINGSYWNIGFAPQGSGSAGGFTDVYATFVIDILDYANTSKFKTMRSIGGYNKSGSSGFVSLNSGLWRSTNAISSLRFYPNDGLTLAWNTNTIIALYGIKSA